MTFPSTQPAQDLSADDRELLEKLQAPGTNERFKAELKKRMDFVKTMEDAERVTESALALRVTV